MDNDKLFFKIYFISYSNLSNSYPVYVLVTLQLLNVVFSKRKRIKFDGIYDFPNLFFFFLRKLFGTFKNSRFESDFKHASIFHSFEKFIFGYQLVLA